ncbi:hypothetical protein PoB_000503600 [Plakobranchus ocellatus]|uniref:Protein kinase domain-containing protein n=1 Tax=Plakobranchus ocellatus TaxID=259542 RepID=A0AAV3XTS1_9GAST|nr:hypothetical protein PoB_000503600 [Plakobranchus ocellatus]
MAAGWVTKMLNKIIQGKDRGATDAFSLGAVLTCLLVGFDLTGRQRNDLHLLTDRPKRLHGPVFNMLRTFEISKNLTVADSNLAPVSGPTEPRCGRPV